VSGAVTTASSEGAALRLWRDPAAWSRTADIVAVLIAFSLPWSTSLVGIFATVWLVTVAPTLDLRVFLQSLKRPICALPIAMFGLAAIGTLWSDAPWGERIYAVGPTAKLLVLPFLFYHYERSPRGMWVFNAFLTSCTLLMVISWVVAFYPHLSFRKIDPEFGIFVKNHIDQSQEFALCAVTLAYPIFNFLRTRRFMLAALLIAIATSLIINMVFVVVSRTALVTMPIMLAVFALLHLRWRSIIVISCGSVALATLAWVTSPQLQWKASTFVSDYQSYQEEGRATSIGVRLVFWQKSLRFIAEAPIIGHGTGSTRGLFERVATGPIEEARSIIAANPHNQTLNVAVQWGVMGIVILYAIWLSHFLLFRGNGLVPWVGLMVVLQNIFTSLFNSHLFDFHEGWMYVLGVGVAGGMVLKAGPHEANLTPGNFSAQP
jgi:O-antigen ligase